MLSDSLFWKYNFQIVKTLFLYKLSEHDSKMYLSP